MKESKPEIVTPIKVPIITPPPEPKPVIVEQPKPKPRPAPAPTPSKTPQKVSAPTPPKPQVISRRMIANNLRVGEENYPT